MYRYVRVRDSGDLQPGSKHKGKTASGGERSYDMHRTILLGLMVIILLTSVESWGAGRLEILLLDEQFPGSDAAFADVLEKSLEDEGFVVRRLDAGDLLPELSTRCGERLLVLPNSACFPADMVSALRSYLAEGGNLLAIGGPLLSQQVVKVGNDWLTQSMLLGRLVGLPPGEKVLDFGKVTPSSDWRDSGTPETEAKVELKSTGITDFPSSVEVSLPSCKFWEFQDIPITKPFPKGETVTTFMAKGSPNARKLMIAWIDSDGARWYTSVDLTTTWKRYALTSDVFVHWKGPGGPEDRLDTGKIVKLKVGFENHNLKNADEPATFSISDIRTMVNPAGNPDFAQPTLETLSPAYKTYRTNAASLVRTSGSYEDLGVEAFGGPTRVVCSIPRYRGMGFNKTAPHRWIPRLAVRMEDGHIGGAAAAMYVQDDEEYRGTVWATLGIDDPEFLSNHREGIGREAASIARRIEDGIFLLSAGVDRASYFEETPVTGAVVLDLRGRRGEVEIRCSITHDPEYSRVGDSTIFEMSKTFALTGKRTICELGPVEGLKPGFYVVRTRMYRDGKLLDEIRQPFSIVESKPVDPSELVTIEGDQFVYKGKPWYSLGINYRPVYVAAMEEKPFWKYWTHPDQYDPEIVEIELALMNKIGLNTVALIYPDIESVPPAFVDFMERAHRHGLKCHVYVAGLEPMSPRPERALKLIRAARLWERPAMFAYDTGWEVRMGREEKRRAFDDHWKRWIEDRYGSVENAEEDWGFALRKEPDGRVHGPTDEQIIDDGPWRRMVAAYRRFWDDLLSRRYMETQRIIDSVDPYHPVGVRSGFGGTGTSAFYALPVMPVDLCSGAKHLDYISPEAYNISGSEQAFREGGFTTLYGKFVSGGKPIYWAELGFSVHPISPEKLEDQRRFYENIYRMFYETRSAGSAAWWWPGYLIWEKSDYSIINPDFTLRPAAHEFTKMAKMSATPYPLKKPDYWIEIDRDRYVRGYAGIFAEKREEYGRAVSEGKTVGLRTAGTGTDSSNFPRVAVGGTPLNGHNPPKYLNGEFNSLEIRDASGRWISVEDGAKVTVKAGEPVLARASLGNTAESKWLSKGESAVFLRAQVGEASVLAPISKDTPFLSDAKVQQFRLSEGITAEMRVSFQLYTAGISFGEKWYVTLSPIKG